MQTRCIYSYRQRYDPLEILVTSADNQTSYRPTVLYKLSTNEESIWEDDNRFQPFNLQMPEPPESVKQVIPAESQLKDIPTIVSTQDLIQEWKWDKNLDALVTPTKYEEKEKEDQDEAAAEDKTNKVEKHNQDFIPLVETRVGTKLSFSLLQLEKRQKEDLTQWESSLVAFRHIHVARFFGVTLSLTDPNKLCLVFEPVPHALSLEFILKSLSYPSSPSVRRLFNHADSFQDTWKRRSERRHLQHYSHKRHRRSSKPEEVSQEALVGAARDSITAEDDDLSYDTSKEEANTANSPVVMSSLPTTSIQARRKHRKPLVSQTQLKHLLWSVGSAVLALQQEGIAVNLNHSSIFLCPNGCVKVFALYASLFHSK